MSTLRTIGDFPRNESGYVDRFIGTAYDTVKKVADNLDDVLKVPNALDDINTAQQDVDSKAAQVALDTQTVADNLELVKTTASAAMAASHLYATVQDGLNNTNNGEYFVIPGPNNGEVFSTLYYNDNGNPKAINTYPSTSGAWDRKNHTGIQAIDTIDGLQEELTDLSNDYETALNELNNKVDSKNGKIYGSTGLTLDDTGSFPFVSAANILADEHYLRANGAKLDGVTDDSSVFQAIIDKVKSQHFNLNTVPSVVFKLPSNCECVIGQTINTTNMNVAIIGSGPTSTKIIAPGTLTLLWTHGTATKATRGVFEIRDIAIIYNNNVTNSATGFYINMTGGDSPSMRVTNVQMLWWGQPFDLTDIGRDSNFTNLTIHGPDYAVSSYPGIKITSSAGGPNVFTTSWIMCNVYNYIFGWQFIGNGMIEGHRFFGSTCYNGWGMVQAYVNADVHGWTDYQAVIWDFYCCDWQGYGYALDMHNCRGVRVNGGFWTFNERSENTGYSTAAPWGARTSAATNAMFSFVNCTDVLLQNMQVDTPGTNTYGDTVLVTFDANCRACRVLNNTFFINDKMYGGIELGDPTGVMPNNQLAVLGNYWTAWVGGDKVMDHGQTQIDLPWIEDNWYGTCDYRGFINIQQQISTTMGAATLSDGTKISQVRVDFPKRRYGNNLFNGGTPSVIPIIQQALADSIPGYWMGESDNAGFYVNGAEATVGVAVTINYIAQGF